ncbi:MAG: COX15/CtaA family protein, partial [Candidatus Binatia bacterium]
MSEPRFDRLRNAYACLVAAATLVLVFAGGLVTSTGSGLAVPDWPLSYGMWFPPMVGGVLFEHGHRMIAGTVGILTLILAVWTWIAEDRRWVRRLAGAALLAVVVQAVLGGLTVIFLLPPAISVAHACLGQIFFCLVVSLAAVTGRSWLEATPAARADPALRFWSLTLVVTVFAQLLIGALMRHLGAGLAIPDFPLSFGRLVPELSSTGVTVAFAHRLGAIVVTVLALGAALRVRRNHGADAWLARPALLVVALVAAQIALGATTIWTGKAVV